MTLFAMKMLLVAAVFAPMILAFLIPARARKAARSALWRALWM